ncbi:MAG TPA: alpha/beta hydrolase [Allosphingosinicella sp.]|nr:alpha/beta hydrolase [Allosphingosinicella sp.]
MWSLLLIPLWLYLALLSLLFLFQGRLIFPAGAAGGARPLREGAEQLSFTAPRGETLRGIHLPPGTARSGTLVLAFAGNAWNAEDAAEYLHDIYPGADIVAFHYRGYRPSTGAPSAKALIGDAPLAYDASVARLRPQRTVAVGLSIGSGIAASLAGKRPLAGLILVTPFDSLKAVAAGHYPWLPIRLLFRHDMEPAQSLRRTKLPVAILSAGRDDVIPPPRADALRRSVGNLAYDRSFPGAGHNDIYRRSDFQAAMREALERITNP